MKKRLFISMTAAIIAAVVLSVSAGAYTEEEIELEIEPDEDIVELVLDDEEDDEDIVEQLDSFDKAEELIIEDEVEELIIEDEAEAEAIPETELIEESIERTKPLTGLFADIARKQIISASSFSVSRGSEPFNLNATLTQGDGKLYYKSDNFFVARVSAKGVVTIISAGTARIKIYAPATMDYDYAEKYITITVLTDKCSIKSVAPTGTESMRIEWNGSATADGYQLSYCANSAFAGEKVISFSAKESGTDIYGLSGGKKYYFRIRSFVDNGGAVKYSGWSAVKSEKTSAETTISDCYIITEGESFTIPDATRYWSSVPEIAAVNDGTVTALQKGFACIIASSGAEEIYYPVYVRTELQERIDAFRDVYPEGYYWNKKEKSKKYPEVSEIPCTDHFDRTYEYCCGQCAGFAALLSNNVFGENAAKYDLTDIDEVKIGDYLRNGGHSLFIIDIIYEGDIIGFNKGGNSVARYDLFSGWNYGTAFDTDENGNMIAREDYIVAAHCNYYRDCGILWDSVFSLDSLVCSDTSYTRYK